MDWRDIPGETPPQDIELLQELVRALSADAVIVDLGTLQGSSGLAMASVCRGEQMVYLVDRFEAASHLEQGGWIEPSREILEEHVSGTGLGSRCVIVEGDTAQVGQEWDKGKIGLIFVDGSHDEASVEADLRAWVPHVQHGGYICLHDYADPTPGVIAAAQKVLGRSPDKIHWLTGVYRVP